MLMPLTKEWIRRLSFSYEWKIKTGILNFGTATDLEGKLTSCTDFSDLSVTDRMQYKVKF